MFVKIGGFRINLDTVVSYYMPAGNEFTRPSIEITFINSKEGSEIFSFDTEEKAEEALKRLDAAAGLIKK